MATELERLVVTLEAQTRAYERALAQATSVTVSQLRRIEGTVASGMTGVSRSFGTLSSLAGTVSRSLGAIGVGVGFGVLTRGITSLVGDMASLGEAAQAAGTDVESFQAIVAAGLTSGIDREQIVSALSAFNNKLAEAADHTSELGRLFRQNNIEIRDSEGNIRDAVVLFGELADLIKNAGSGAERVNIAMTATNRSGAKLVPLLAGGRAEFERMLEAARASGQVIEKELIDVVDRMADNWSVGINRVIREAQAGIGALTHIIESIATTGTIQDLTPQIAQNRQLAELAEQRAEIQNRILGFQKMILDAEGDIQAVTAAVNGEFEKLTQTPKAVVDGLKAANAEMAELNANSLLVEAALAASGKDVVALTGLAQQLGEQFSAQLAAVNQLQEQIRGLKENSDFVPTDLQTKLDAALQSLQNTSSVLSKIQGQVQAIGDIDPSVDITVTRGVGGGADPAMVAQIVETLKTGFDQQAATIEAIKQVLAEGNLSAAQRTQLLQRLESLQGQEISATNQVGSAVEGLNGEFASGANDIVGSVGDAQSGITTAQGATTAAVTALPERIATSLGPIFRSANATQELGLDFAFPQKQQINALELERQRLQLQIQTGELSEEEIKKAEARIAEIGQEIAKLQLYINELEAAIAAILPALQQMGLGGISLFRHLAFELERLGFDVLGILREFERLFPGGGGFAEGGEVHKMAYGGGFRRQLHGLLRGPGNDKMRVLASGGEFFVNEQNTRRHRRLLEAINDGRIEYGDNAGIDRALIRQAMAMVREMFSGSGHSRPSQSHDRPNLNIGLGGLHITTPDYDSFRKAERTMAQEFAGQVVVALRERGIAV